MAEEDLKSALHFLQQGHYFTPGCMSDYTFNFVEINNINESDQI